jgi:predicted permease
MRALRRVIRRHLRDLIRGRAMARDIDREIEFHLAMRAEEARREGLDSAAARLEAERRFGRVAAIGESCREARGVGLIDQLRRDARFALRMFAARRASALVAMLTIAVGIGATTAAFSLVDGVLLRPLPFHAPERLVVIWDSFGASRQAEVWLAPPEIEDLRAGARSLDAVAAMVDVALNMTGAGEPVRVDALAASANLPAVLGVPPRLGRWFSEDEDRSGSRPVAVLSHRAWVGRFGAAPDVVGRTIGLDGAAHEIVGVMPASFRMPPLSSVFPADPDVYVPFEARLPAPFRENRTVNFVHAVARLGEGSSALQAAAELRTLAARLEARHPAVYAARGFSIDAVPLARHVTSRVRASLWLLLAGVGLVLLVACVNVANILMAWGAAREQEMMVRAALGAPGARLVLQLLIESSLLSVIGGAAGVALAGWGIGALASAAPAWIPVVERVTLNLRVLAFALLLTLATAVAFGLLPALLGLRASIAGSLSSGPRGSARPEATRIRKLLIVGETALAFSLLVAAALVVRGFVRLQQVDLGFSTDRLVVGQVSLPPALAGRGMPIASVWDRALEQLARIGAAQRVALVSHLPLSGAVLASSFEADPVAGRADGAVFPADHRSVSAGYFDAMGMRIVRGRAFGESDREGNTAIIDETLANRIWPGMDPVGRQLRWIRSPTPLTIVGVVSAVRHAGVASEPRETVYRPYWQHRLPAMWVVVQGAGPAASIAPEIRRAIARVDAALPVAGLRTGDELVAGAMAQPRFAASAMMVLGAVAVVLAAAGLYGLTTYLLALRQRELGIRLAVGAAPWSLSWLLLREGALLACAGIVLGLIATLPLTTWLRSLLFGVSPTDPAVLSLAALTLIGAAVLAAAVPAWRASRIDPVEILRHD